MRVKVELKPIGGRETAPYIDLREALKRVGWVNEITGDGAKVRAITISGVKGRGLDVARVYQLIYLSRIYYKKV